MEDLRKYPWEGIISWPRIFYLSVLFPNFAPFKLDIDTLLSQETQLKRLDARTLTTALYAKYFEFLKIFHHAKQEFTKITD